MNAINEWANLSHRSAEGAAALVVRLEERARCPDQQAVNAALRRILDPKPGQRWLEVGCGSGVLGRPLVPSLAPTGSLLGLDVSVEMLRAARQIALEMEQPAPLAWGAGQAESLPFANGTFDGVFAARVLLHVTGPQMAVGEMVRVARPSAWVVVMDWDFDTVAVDHSNRELTRRVLHWRTDHEGGDNWSGRKLWRYMTRAGLENLSLHPVVSVAQSEADSLYQSLEKAAHVACAGGGITSAEQADWTRELKALLAAGQFLATIVYYIVRGQRR